VIHTVPVLPARRAGVSFFKMSALHEAKKPLRTRYLVRGCWLQGIVEVDAISASCQLLDITNLNENE